MRTLLLIAVAIVGNVQAADLAPFTTDGCSSFPDGTAQQPTLWLHCCIKHDLAYWMGGAEAQRLEADTQLERCVAATGESEIAKLMFQGVRAGGGPSLPTPYRWGYGWPLGRGYQALSTQDIEQVQKRLAELAAAIHALSEALRDGEPTP